MATDDTCSYLFSSSKCSRSDKAEDTAERGSIFEGGDTEDSTSIILSRIDRQNMASWAGQPSIVGSTESVRMVLLTLPAMGLQYDVSHPIEIVEADGIGLGLRGELR